MRIKYFTTLFLTLGLVFSFFPVVAQAHFHSFPIQNRVDINYSPSQTFSVQSFHSSLMQFISQFFPQVHISSRCYQNVTVCHTFPSRRSVTYIHPVPSQEIQIYRPNPVRQFRVYQVHKQSIFIQQYHQYQPAQFEYSRVYAPQTPQSPTLRLRHNSTNPYCVIKYVDGLRREICS